MDATPWARPKERPEAEARLVARLDALARAAGVPAPPIEAGHWAGAEFPGARAVGRGEDRRIVHTAGLPQASTAEQDWQLARCLARWVSPTADRRARIAVVLAYAGLVVIPSVGIVLHGLEMFDAIAMPRSVALSIVAAPLLALLALAWAGRRSARTRDDVAFGILRRAGRDPVDVVTEVYEDQTRYSWWHRLWRSEPTRAERLAAASAQPSTQVATPLH